MPIEVKNFGSSADEAKVMPNARMEAVNVLGQRIIKLTLSPDWKWATDIKPLIGTDSCQATHTGIIVEGDKRARKINFPTANVIPGKHIFPRKGVYCVEVYIKNKIYLGISNFGERPTVDGTKLLLETHIFNFNKEIYGNDLTVRFLTFIRPEKKFANFDELTKQIKKDIETAKKFHNI